MNATILHSAFDLRHHFSPPLKTPFRPNHPPHLLFNTFIKPFPDIAKNRNLNNNRQNCAKNLFKIRIKILIAQ